MKRFFGRTVMSVLILILSLSALAACKGRENEGSTPPPTQTEEPDINHINRTAIPEPEQEQEQEQEPEIVIETDGGYTETLMDLGGRKIVFGTTAVGRYTYNANDKDLTPNETIAIIESIKQIEKDYNCTIEIKAVTGSLLVAELLASKASGDVPYDIVESGVTDSHIDKLYSNNLCIPVNDSSISDIIMPETNPWLPSSDFSYLYGKQYGVHFKTSNSGNLLMVALLFNKDLVYKYELGNPYEMVKNNTWTWDVFETMCAQIVAKSDGTVKPFLYSNDATFLPLMMASNNGAFADNTIDGYQFVAHKNNNALEALNFVAGLVSKDYIHTATSSAAETAGAAGEAVFLFNNYACLKKYTQQTIQTEYSFGLLPAPVGPNSTGYNTVFYTDAMFHIMNNTEQPEQVAAVLVAIANRTCKINIIDTELRQTLQDVESGEILELLLNNVTLDYSNVVSDGRSTLRDARRGILNLSQTPIYAMESIADKMQAAFDSVIVVE